MLQTRLRPAAVAASLLLALTACGSGESEDGADGGSGGDMAGMDMSSMNEPDATPADEVDGDVEEGEFVVLDTAPPGSDEVTGATPPPPPLRAANPPGAGEAHVG